MTFKEFFSQKVLFFGLALSIVIFLISAGLIVTHIGSLPETTIIHFDSFSGIDYFGEPADLWWIWGIGFFMMIINAILGIEFFYRERIATYLFFATNLLISILILIVVATIISVN
ncbi:MAG: hypothetical protein QMD50_03710 [Patescibacteria group bacterium]|nr:hypothetical protein [Patescibacteria group bacterium]